MTGVLQFIANLIINIGAWIEGLLTNVGIPGPWVDVIMKAITGVALGMLPLVAVVFLIVLERKVVARIQDRLGPNLAGPYGVIQTIADAIKLLTKEDITPSGADRWVFNLAPLIIVTAAVLIWAVIPLGVNMIGTDINIGIFYVLAMGSASTFSLLMAGYGSNNKYSLVGGFRAVAQLISYEIPQILAVMVPVMLAGSMSMQSLVGAQQVIFLVALPLSALIFFISNLAEVGRIPFDLLEAESEIVAGYFIEYSGMKFGLFYLAEFMNSLAICCVFTTLFLGGWRGPFAEQVPMLGMVYFFIKALVIFFVLMWFRGTLWRVRIDQILALNWKFLVPLALVNLCVVALVGKALPAGVAPWTQAGALLAANVVVIICALGVVAAMGRRERLAVSG